MTTNRLVALLVVIFMAAPAIAEDLHLQCAPVFADGAVLQQGIRLSIRGTRAAGPRVSLTFGDQQSSTTAKLDGNWKLYLEPLVADKLAALEQAPAHRLGQPRELAYLAEFPLGDKASYLTGQLVHLDGGLLSQ